MNLSGGEAQKLALARALYRGGEILILDEPSSALDPKAEDELISRFKEISENRLVIYISHRLTCSQSADEILYIRDGRVAEKGTHEELMHAGGQYAELYNAQAQYYVYGRKAFQG